MHRPLRVPFYLRLWHLIRGLFFYNTVYWKKASDGLNMPSLSMAEREERRPARDLEIIRPRENPRARIERGAEVSVGPVESKAPPITVKPVFAEIVPEDEPESLAPAVEETGEQQSTTYIKRKRYRRKHFHDYGAGGGLLGRGDKRK